MFVGRQGRDFAKNTGLFWNMCVFFLCFLEALYILKTNHGFFVKPVFGALYAASIFEDRAAYFEDRAAHDFPTRLALFSNSTKFGFPLDLGVCFLC